MTLRPAQDRAATDEREAVVLHLRGQAASVRRMAGRHVTVNDVLSEDEADQLARRIDAIADGIDAGLHLAEAPPAGRREGNHLKDLSE